METVSEVYVGVDISKDSLDIYIHPIGKSFKIANTKSEIQKLIKKLTKYQVKNIVCEATGGYEKLLADILKKSLYALWIVDPRRIKGFIIASGCRSKTDKIDAQKIAEFAAKNNRDYISICKTKNQEILLAFVNRKNDLVKFLGSEKTRLKHPSHALYLASIKKIIKTLECEIKSIDKQIQSLIAQDDELNSKSQLLESIPGIGKASAATLLATVPELGKLSNAKVSALIGVCPYDNASGKYKGKKFIKGGRITPRNMLYMCALTTIKYNLVLKKIYDRLRANNRPFKVAIVTVMHKLVIFANSILKKGEKYKVQNY